MLKKEKIHPAYVSKHSIVKKIYSFNDFKQRERTMALSYSQKTIVIIKRNNFLLFELLSLKCNRKETSIT